MTRKYVFLLVNILLISEACAKLDGTPIGLYYLLQENNSGIIQSNPVNPNSSGLILPAFSLWLKADSLSLTDGASVASWSDSSGQGQNVSQATETDKPKFRANSLNSLPVLELDGTDYLMRNIQGSNVFNASETSMFFVQQQKSSPAVQKGTTLHWESAPDTNRITVHLALEDDFIYFDYGNLFTGARTNVAQPGGWENNWQLVEIYRSGASVEIKVNGTLIKSATFTNSPDLSPTADLMIGHGGSASHFLEGFLAEVIVSRTALSSADRTTVTCYLAKKWGLTASGCP